MKKTILCLLVQLFAFHITVADDLKPAQVQLRNNLVSFLKEEGYVPEIDSDGDIKFKKEGSPYWIRIHAQNESPMFVSIFQLFEYPETYSRDVLKAATINLNFYKGIKVLCAESAFRIQAEMYLVDAEAFKYAFYQLMSQMALVEGDILDECAQVGQTQGGNISTDLSNRIPFIITSIKIGNTDSKGEIIQDYGNTIYDYKSQYLSPKITITPLTTNKSPYRIYIRLYKNGILQRGTSSPSEYTYSHEISLSDTTTITLPGWGSNKAGTWSAGKYRFEIWYNNYCLGSQSFSII